VKNKKMLWLAFIALAALFLAGALSACGDEAAETTETTAGGQTTATSAAPSTTAAPADTTATSSPGTTTAAGEWDGTFDGEYIIGAIDSLTGGGAMGGAEQLWAQEKAVADQNAKGGLLVDGKNLEIKLKVVDDKSEATEAAAAMEKLIKVEGCDLVLSTQVTPINLAAASIAEKYQKFYMMNTSFINWVADQNFKWSACVFNTPDDQAEVPFQIMELQPESERATKWGVLTEDNQDGQAIGGGMKAMAEKHGQQIVEYQTFTPGAKDFSSALLKLKSAGVDALLGICSPADGITFVKQMRDMDFSPKFMFGWKGFWPQEFMEGLGAASNYILHDGFWSEDLPNPGAKELGQAYRAAHNDLDSVSIGEPYAAAQVMFEAINRAGSVDPGAVRDQVFNGSFPGTVMGDLQFNEKGVASIPHMGLQWMDGKRIIIWPDMGNTLQWFKPWDER